MAKLYSDMISAGQISIEPLNAITIYEAPQRKPAEKQEEIKKTGVSLLFDDNGEHVLASSFNPSHFTPEALRTIATGQIEHGERKITTLSPSESKSFSADDLSEGNKADVIERIVQSMQDAEVVFLEVKR